jgi:hypothetical protein
MVFLYILLSAFVTNIALSLLTLTSDSSSNMITAAVIVLSSSIWGGAAWVVGTLKKLDLPKNKLNE